MAHAFPPQAPPHPGIDRLTPIAIEARVSAMTGTYSEYAAVEPLRHMAAHRDIHTDQYVGQGLQSMVYRFDHDGRTLTARIHKQTGPKKPRDVVYGHLAASAACGDLPILQQSYAGSLEHGVVISEYVDGDTVFSLNRQQAAHITDEQMLAFAHTVVAADKRPIELDSHPMNLLYTADGFRIIDYDYDPQKEQPEGFESIIHMTRYVNATQLGDPLTVEIVGRDGGNPESCKVAITLLEKLASVVPLLATMDADDLDIGLETIHNTISENQRWLDTFAPSELPVKSRLAKRVLRTLARR